MAVVQVKKTWSLGNGPHLAAAANILGVAGATDDAKATALRTAVAGATKLEANEFIEEFTNKVLLQFVYKDLGFSDPFFKKFGTTEGSYKAIAEVIDSQLLATHTFDKEKRMSDAQERAKQLSTTLGTVLQEYTTLTMQKGVVKAAFLNEGAYSKWVSKQTKLLRTTFQVRLFEVMQVNTVDKIQNKIYIGAKYKTFAEKLVAILAIGEQMFYPSTDFNIGYADPTDAKNVDKVKKQTASLNELTLIANAIFKTGVSSISGAIKVGDGFYSKDNLPQIIKTDRYDVDTVALVEDDAFKAYLRVYEMDSNNWAANMTIEYYLHFWLVAGIVPWGVGVEIKFADKPVGASDHHDTFLADLHKILDQIYVPTKEVA